MFGFNSSFLIVLFNSSFLNLRLLEDIGADRPSLPNAILATFLNRPDPLSFLKEEGSDVISLLQAQTICLIFQLFNFWLPDKNQIPLQANCISLHF